MRRTVLIPNYTFCFFKNFFFLLVLLCLANISAFGQNDFITTWKTDNEGVSNDQSIRIPTTGDGYNYDVDWDNDGTFDSLNVSGSITHEYASPGTYTIRIRGDFPRIYFNGGGDRMKILSIDQWGDIAWTSFSYAFRGAINMTLNAQDAPDLSGVTNLERMFLNADLVNSDISNWDVSNVTNMVGMLSGAEAFNQDLSAWNISNVSYMNNMFNNSGMSIIQYDRTLTGWESQGVSGITLGAAGLGYCDSDSVRNSLINTYNWTITGDSPDCSIHDHFVTRWRTNNAGESDNDQIKIPTKTGPTYNYDVDWDNDGEFDTLGVTGSITHTFPSVGTYTIRIRGVFPRIYFNNTGDKNKILSINQWGTIAWTNMEHAFYGAKNMSYSATDVPDLSGVTNLAGMFRETENFNGDLNNWDVSTITNMADMFKWTKKYNKTMNAWDVSNVTNMSGMFGWTTYFNAGINAWDVSSVTDMSYMFSSAHSFKKDLNAWDVSNVTNMSFMFISTDNFNGDISTWDVSKVTNMSYMFNYAIKFNGDLSTWDVSKVINMVGMFENADDFNGDISAWNVSKVKLMNEMFKDAESFNGDLSNWNVSKVTNMSKMFSGASAFNRNLSNWNVSKVTDMEEMFLNATSFNRSLGAWDISLVTNMNKMLKNANLSVARYDNTLIGWNNLGVYNKNLGQATGLNYCNAQNARESLINVYGWTITEDEYQCAPLPVELLDFTARGVENESVLLNWTTASEENNQGFEVQRSNDGHRWETLGFVEGKGFSDVFTDYEFLDQSPHSGINYYRLRQIDFDGNFEYSEVVSVTIESDNIALKIFPNPAQDVLTVENASGQLEIYNALGQRVKTVFNTEPQASIDVSGLDSGYYLLKVLSGQEEQTSVRFIKK